MSIVSSSAHRIVSWLVKLRVKDSVQVCTRSVRRSSKRMRRGTEGGRAWWAGSSDLGKSEERAGDRAGWRGRVGMGNKM